MILLKARKNYEQSDDLMTVHVLVMVELLHFKFRISTRRKLFKLIDEFLMLV